MSRFVNHALVGLLVAAAAAAPSFAQNAHWPNERPIRLIVPFQAGSYSDVIARVVTQRLEERLGQQIVVENRVGGGGSVGTAAVARSMADGYTMLLGGNGPMVVNMLAASEPTFDPIKDFAPAAMIGNSPFAILATPTLPAKNIKDLIALAKVKPATLNYASSGPGTMAHLIGALLEKMADIRLIHVPYRGAEQSVFDLMEGRIELLMAPIAPSLAHIREGKVRALATTGSTRNAQLPDVPTVAEQGLPGYEAVLWNALVLPAKTPDAVVVRINRETIAVVDSPDVRAALDKQGVTIETPTPEGIVKRIHDDIARWSPIIREAGFKPK